MTDYTCSVEGCQKKKKSDRRMCSMHASRWERTGTLEAKPQFRTPDESLAARTREDERGCLVWLGALGRGGYGVIQVEGRTVAAHRYAWERSNGPIPSGRIIDHMCHNRACVNVKHLRLATHSQNSQNRAGADRGSKSGIRNVNWVESDQAWVVKMKVAGVIHRGGQYKDINDAAAAAVALRRKVMPWSIK